MSLQDAYLAGHKACGLKVGDKVRVIRKAGDREQGWGNSWERGMSVNLKKIRKITKDYLEAGFKLNDLFLYPWFVLEKVEDGEEEKIKTSDLDFGCQQEHVKTLVHRIIDYIDNK